MRRQPLPVFLAVVLATATLLSSCGLGGASSPVDPGADTSLDNPYNDENHLAILEYLDAHIVKPDPGQKIFSAYHIFASSSNRIYIWALCAAYDETSAEGHADGSLDRISGVSLPVVLEVEVWDNLLRVTGHRVPGDGTAYAGDVRDLFPETVQPDVFGIQDAGIIPELELRSEERAREWLGLEPRPPEWRYLFAESDPEPVYAALLKDSVDRYSEIQLVSPDGRYVLAENRGLVATSLFEGGRSFRLCGANPNWGADDWLMVRPVGWASESECLWIALGLQMEGPHKGARGAALFTGSVLSGETEELVFFESSQLHVKSVAWYKTSSKVYVHLTTEIWEMDAACGTAKQIRSGLPSYDGLFTATPSPDGRQFAYVYPLPGKTAITILDNASGQEISIHPDGEALSYWPIWSPDSRYLAVFIADRKPEGDTLEEPAYDILPDEDGPFAAAKSLLIYDTKLGSSSVIRLDDKWLMWPTWAPDSRTLFFLTAEIPYDPALHPVHPRAEYDSVWAAQLDCVGSPEEIAVLPPAGSNLGDGDILTWPISALPGGEGILLQVNDADGYSVWVAARGKAPYRLMEGSANASLSSAAAQGSDATDCQLALYVRTKGGHEIWLLSSSGSDVICSKCVTLGKTGLVDVLAFIGDKLILDLNDSDVSAVGVYAL